MEVRVLRRQEILPALHLIWDVFVEEVAPLYMPEGVREFQETIKFDTVDRMCSNGELTMFGAFEGDELCGVIALKSSGHMCMFYVRKDCQGKGAGRMLYNAVARYCQEQLHLPKLTVHAAPGAVPKYMHMGMRPTGEEQVEKGVRFVPMEMQLTVLPSEKKNHTPIIVGVVVAAIVMVVLSVVGLIGVVREVRRQVDESFSREQDIYEGWQDGDIWDGGDIWNEDEQSDSGDEEDMFNTIRPYVKNNLSYTIKEDGYEEAKITSGQQIEFDVDYPQVKGLPSGKDEQVNQILKDAAMSTADALYISPSEDHPFIGSDVDYIVSYMDENLLCVAFADHSFQGNMYAEFYNLRTRIIDLNSGEEYLLENVLSINDELVEKWRDALLKEDPGNLAAENLSAEVLKHALEGQIVEGRYYANLILEDGEYEIGLTYAYPGNNGDAARGWVTGEFSDAEISAYKNNSKLWDMVQSDN